jgi:hypothetical protein
MKMMDRVRMVLEVWVHGTAGKVDVACEVDVLTVTGENIPSYLLEQMLNGGDQVSLLDDFGHFETEHATRVEVDYVFEDYSPALSGWYAEIISFEVLPNPGQES